jgi:hypothetical protein
MDQCTFCADNFVDDACVLQTLTTYLKENPILCNECGLNISHNCIYVFNTGSIIFNHLISQINHPEIFGEYYEIYKCHGHESISLKSFYNSCNELICNREFIAQLIPLIIQQHSAQVNKPIEGLSNQYIIDVQGFKMSDYEFIMREICIMSCDATFLLHCIVKLPCEITELTLGYQRQTEWLINNFHGLNWNTNNGYSIPQLRRLLSAFCHNDSVFYCKGSEKVCWISKLFRLSNVKDLTELGCPALSKLNFKIGMTNCTYHVPIENHACALRNSLQLQFWMKLQNSKVTEEIAKMTIV